MPEPAAPQRVPFLQKVERYSSPQTMPCSTGTAPVYQSIFNLGTRRVSVSNATPCPLHPRERDAAPTVQETGIVSELFWTGAEDLAATWIRSPDSPASSESLIRFIDFVGTDLENVTLVWTPEQRG